MSETANETTRGQEAETPQARHPLKRFLPLVVLVAAGAAIWALDLHRFLSFDALREHREFLMHFVADQTVLAIIVFMSAYAVTVALSLPGATVLTVTGGFLFGSVVGTLWTVIAATIGAAAVFLAAKTALGDVLRAKAGPFLRRMEDGFKENAFNYLLVLRLIPLFPFFIVNLVPAFLGVGLRTFFIATFLGIIPGAFVFASVGAGLGSVFDSMDSFTLQGVLTPQVITALVGLSVLSLLPVAYKKLRKAKASS